MSKLGVTILGSGSKGNCTLIHNETDGILIDAGFSRREFLRRLKAAGLESLRIRAILITHEHADHINGLRPCAQALEVPIFASRHCAEKLRSLDPDLGSLVRFAQGATFPIADFNVTAFGVSHDTVDPVAFAVTSGEHKVGMATDLGRIGSTVTFHLRDCNVLVLESNHDLNMLAASKRCWSLKQRILGPQGHLSNLQACELLKQLAGPSLHHLILAHISQECNTPELALTAANAELQELGRQDIDLKAASQNEPMPTVWC
jgi:phosphoribosyl 1,2-cyclic phosphodiesterase